MKAKFVPFGAALSVVLGTVFFAYAETSNPVQIFVRPSVSCKASPDNPITGQTITWTATVAPPGDTSVYSFLWSGTDGLSGNVGVATKTYATTGQKSAQVKVTPKIAVPIGVDLSKTATCPPINVGEPPKPDLTASLSISGLAPTGNPNEYYVGIATLQGFVH
ncbi:MAG: hypothetical protein G01um101417_641, partial [Parcubacteria group bacterium Gr01-1014_17]